MKINNVSIIILTTILLGCHQSIPSSVHQNNHIVKNQKEMPIKQTPSIDEGLSLLSKNTWQFEKGENLIDENLKLLGGTITLNFSKSKKRGEMHDPDYDLDYQYHFSVDAGCNYNGGIVGFDKTVNKLVKINTVSFSTLVGCYPNHENTIHHFIQNNNIRYQVDEKQLLLKDDNNQTLFFKKK